MPAWNVKKLLEWGIDYFTRKDIPEPRLSAELLLSSVLNFSRVKLYLNYNYEPSQAELDRFKQLIYKRLEHMPIQYILGQAFFRKVKLHVDKNVLIPRPETELLVEEALEIAKGLAERKKLNILEVGTGSGAIAISLAYELAGIDFNITATDKSSRAVEIAKKNAEDMLEGQKLDRISFSCADIVPYSNDFKQKTGEIDMVISNPPYISSANFKSLPRQVKDYEPREALVGGESGSECYGRIFEGVRPFLRQPCYLVLEIDELVAEEVKKQCIKAYGLVTVEIKKDYNKKDRMIIARVDKVSL
ncbi:MAG: peptide chain release factor N(5)-glutamine methyltransferase [Actinomycetota bacterium]